MIVEALEAVQRKKKEIESDKSLLQSTNPGNGRCPAVLSNNESVAPPASFRLSSVRDIYWPSSNLPVPVPVPVLPLPAPMHSSQFTRLPSPSINSTNRDLTATFDDRLTSDDPFHDAELRSLNDVIELNHLYSAANTIRR